jgi:hypothetical protein
MAKVARVFSFQPSYTTSVPVIPNSHAVTRETDHPFKKEFFDVAAPTIISTGKAAVQFVPTAYWVEARGIEASKADELYMKGKLRDQFNAWRDATKVITVKQVREPSEKNAKGKVVKVGKIITPEESTNEKRGKFEIVMIYRKGDEPASAFPEGVSPEPGIMMWMRLNDTAKKQFDAAQAALKAAGLGKQEAAE